MILNICASATSEVSSSCDNTSFLCAVGDDEVVRPSAIQMASMFTPVSAAVAASAAGTFLQVIFSLSNRGRASDILTAT